MRRRMLDLSHGRFVYWRKLLRLAVRSYFPCVCQFSLRIIYLRLAIDTIVSLAIAVVVLRLVYACDFCGDFQYDFLPLTDVNERINNECA
jgi:hypothetical protein